MIIFAFDPHGQTKGIIEACEIFQPSAVILLGDNELKQRIPIIFESVIKNGTKIFAIEGNHDTAPKYKEDLPYMLDGKVVEIDGLRIGGYSMGLSDVMCSQQLDIVVSHYPPTGFKDRPHYSWHYDSIMTAELTLKSNAVAVFHGHIHGDRLFDPVGIYDISSALAVSTCEYLFDENGSILGKANRKGFTLPDEDFQYCVAEMMSRSYCYETKSSLKENDAKKRFIESAYYRDGCGQCVPCNDNHHCYRETRVDNNFNIDLSNGKLNGSAAFHFEAAKQRAYKLMLSELLSIRKKVKTKLEYRGFGGLLKYRGEKEWLVLDETHQITEQKIKVKGLGEKTAQKYFENIRLLGNSYDSFLLFNKEQTGYINPSNDQKIKFVNFLKNQCIKIGTIAY